jgi:hypothetical protein
MKQLIAFTGLKGSGKDTAVQATARVNVKFATLLKKMIETLLVEQGVDRQTIHRMLEGDLKEVPSPYLNGRTPRHAMQTIGTEWGRNCMGEDIWVNLTMNVVDACPGAVAISDARFPNEVAAIQARGGKVYRIDRGLPQNDLHPSEASILDLAVDGVIINDFSSAEEFRGCIQQLLHTEQ